MGSQSSYSYNGHNAATANQPRPQREKVNFPTNVPVEVQLEDGDGILQAGAYGDQYRYWLTEGKIMWVEPSVHDAIQATTASPFDCYRITKSETRKGGKRTIAWHVSQIGGEAAPVNEPPAHVARAMREYDPAPATPAKPPATATEAAAAMRAHEDAEDEAEAFAAEMMDRRARQRAAMNAIEPGRALDTAASAKLLDPRGPGGQVAPPAAHTPGARLVEGEKQRPLSAQHAAEARLMECLMAAIRGAAAAECYALAQALQIRWTSEDVRAFALSLFISAEKGGR